MTKIAINGLGRIGRAVVRALAEEHIPSPVGGGLGRGRSSGDSPLLAPLLASSLMGEVLNLVAANGPAAIDTHLHLLKYDSVHGAFRGDVSADGETIKAGPLEFTITHERDPNKLPWAEMGVECGAGM